MTNAVSIAQGGSNNVTMRNRIINGAMTVSQYNGTSSFTPAAGNFITDRFQYQSSQASKFTAQQLSASPPVGFGNYLGMTVASTATVGSGDYFLLRQNLEGFNTYDFAWGTANAKTVTLSFQVYSSLTGTFGGSIENYAENRSYPFSYTVSSANTWTQISVTIPGDTSGTWVGASSAGSMRLNFSLGSGSTYSGTAGSWSGTAYFQPTGSVSVVATSLATFYITGVQLEAGTTATPFEYRQYGTELVLCQRYFEQVSFSNGLEFLPLQCENTTTAYGSFRYIVTKRATPTAALVNTSSIFITNASGSGVSTTVGFSYSGVDFVRFNCTSSGLVAGNISMFYMSSPGSIQISAEL